VRYESRLMRGVPANAHVYVGAPNYGESLAQGYALFEERVRQSPVLQEWWNRQGPRGRGPGLGEIVSRLRRLGEYVGDEVVVAFVPAGNREHALYLAEVRAGGLKDFVERELFAASPHPPRIQFVSDPAAMPAAAADLYVLIRADVVVASTDRGTLRAAVLAYDGKAPGLVGTPFGQRIAEAYRDGTGLLVAADATRIAHSGPFPGALGIDDFQYFIAEHTEVGGQATNSAEMTFSGPRRGIASWLGDPAPMGALEFVSENAGAVASFVIKSPALVFDDLLGQASDPARATARLAEIESALDLRLRDDLLAALGSEMTIAFDGPALPTPALKLIVEVNDPLRLEQSLEKLVEAAQRRPENKAEVRLEHEQAGGRTCHTLRITERGRPTIEAHYAFADGYLVAAASRALVLQAIAVRENGGSLARSPRLASLWPADGRPHVSALLYQNLAGIAGPLAQGLGAAPASQAALDNLAAAAKPTLVYAYGGADRIQVAGDLFSADPSALALPMLLGDLIHPKKAGGATR
jgi:hypothetical protein